MHMRRNSVRALAWSLVVTLLLAAPAAGQKFGVTARTGTGMSQGMRHLTDTHGVEGRVMVGRELAAAARWDAYQFGFACIEAGPCQNEANAVTLGAQYRPYLGRVVSFYLGGDAGGIWWPGDLQGWVVRPRTGVDVRLAGPLAASAEYGYAWFFHSARTGDSRPPPDFVGLSAGLSLRF
jgi:hypothetical protein